MKVLNKDFITEISDGIIKNNDVINVDISDMDYDEDNKLHFYNNIIRVIFDKTSFNGFKLDKFNTHDADATQEKFNNHLEKSEQKLNDYINKINDIKKTLPKIKKVVDYIDSLKLENHKDIKKIGYSHSHNELMITIYTDFW